MTDMLEKGDMIQIKEPHPWAPCVAIVEELKSFGCMAGVWAPGPDGSVGCFYIRLADVDYVPLGVKAKVIPP